MSLKLLFSLKASVPAFGKDNNQFTNFNTLIGPLAAAFYVLKSTEGSLKFEFSQNEKDIVLSSQK